VSDFGFKENISNEEIDQLELSWFKGEIALVETPQQFDEILPLLREEKVLGFDTETKPSFTKGIKHKIALIQLATEKTVYLIRVNKMRIPDGLIDIFTDGSILKIGVAVRDDIRFFRGRKNRFPAGFVDLQQVVGDFGIKCAGLKKLVAIILGFKISKKQQVTDWEVGTLTEAQQVYAATDAWVCREIYLRLAGLDDKLVNFAM